MLTNFKELAEKFAKKHGVTLEYLGEPEYRKHFIDDNTERYVFKLRLKRNKKQYTFSFGQSIADGNKKPTMYDVLACLEKHGFINYYDFLNTFGYDDNKNSYKLYLRVQKEYKNVERLFGDILDELREII